MSVINKMLRDLDERSPETAAANPLLSEIRPVQADSHAGGRTKAIAVFAGIALLAAVAAALWLTRAKAPAPDRTVAEKKAVEEVPAAVQQAQFPLKLTSQLTLPPEVERAAPSIPDTDSAATPVRVAEADKPVREKQAADAEPKRQTEAPNSSALKTAPAVVAPAVAASANGKEAPSKIALAEPVKPAAAESKRNVDTLPAAEAPVGAMPPKQIRELTPHERAENEYRKAAALIQQARLPEAAPVLEQALAIDAHHAGARQLLVGLYVDLKRTDDAVRVAQEGLAQDSAQTGLAMILARLQVDRSDLAGAIETLQRSLPSGAERADYQAFLAALMQRAGRHKEAIAHYAVAVRKSPQNGIWWMGMGISLQADGRAAEAAEAFGRAKSAGGLSAELQAFVDGRLAQLQR